MRCCILTLLLAFSTATPVFAEAAHAAPVKHEKDPDPLSFTGYKKWDLAVYTVVVFILLFLILNKFAFPNIVEGLKKREALIDEAKAEALAAKAAAEKARLELEAKMAEANDKIRAMLEEARRDAEVARATERELGKKEADAERERAKREIESAKNQALNEIYEKSVDLATMISTKAVRKSLSADDHRRLVDESLAELKTGRI